MMQTVTNIRYERWIGWEEVLPTARNIFEKYGELLPGIEKLWRFIYKMEAYQGIYLEQPEDNDRLEITLLCVFDIIADFMFLAGKGSSNKTLPDKDLSLLFQRKVEYAERFAEALAHRRREIVQLLFSCFEGNTLEILRLINGPEPDEMIHLEDTRKIIPSYIWIKNGMKESLQLVIC